MSIIPIRKVLKYIGGLVIMSNVEFKKFDLIAESLLLISSIYMIQFVLVGLAPMYKIGLQSSLALIYLGFLNSELHEEEKTYSVLKVIILCTFIFITIFAAISSVGSLVISIEKHGLEYVLKSSKSYGIWVYFVICFLQPIILPFPEPVTIMTGSAAFGPSYGFIVGYFGTMAGIITMFFIARIGGETLVTKLVSPKQLERYRSFVVKNELIILVGLFILPILPDEVVCVGAGVSRVSFKKFAVIAFLSKALTSYTYSQSLELTKIIETIPTPWVVFLAIALLCIYLVSREVNKIKRNKY